MTTTPKSTVIRCKGHPNVKASHAKTLELTRDPSITAAGTCIIGVDAQYDETELLRLRGPLEIELRCGDVTDRLTARANPKFTAGAPLIFRRMPTPEPRTFAIAADKGSSRLDRELVAALQRPGAELTVTVTERGADTAREEDGLLYLVGTPIGNMDDLSPRALAVLQSVDLVLCEDTRTTKSLLSGFGVVARMTSYHDHNERDRAPEFVRRLADGARIALVSEAGMPTISDPGYHLVRQAAEAGVPVTCVPGPDAVTTAISLSGLPSDDFRFLGFPPRKTNARRDRLREIEAAPYTSIFYESPHRIEETLSAIADLMPDRAVVLCRNLTKFAETILRGTAAEILAEIADGAAINGELVLVIAGSTDAAAADQDEPDSASIERMINSLVASGVPTKAIGNALADALGISKRDGFERALAAKKARDGA